MRSPVQSWVPLQESTAKRCVFFVYIHQVIPQRTVAVMPASERSERWLDGLTLKSCLLSIRLKQLVAPVIAPLEKEIYQDYIFVRYIELYINTNVRSISPLTITYIGILKSKKTNTPFEITSIRRQTLSNFVD